MYFFSYKNPMAHFISTSIVGKPFTAHTTICSNIQNHSTPHTPLTYSKYSSHCLPFPLLFLQKGYWTEKKLLL